MTKPPRISQQTAIGSDVDLEQEDIRLLSGRRLTDDAVEEFVEAARAGRPSLSEPGAHSPSITLRLPRSLLERLDEEAARTGRRRSEIIREALKERLAG